MKKKRFLAILLAIAIIFSFIPNKMRRQMGVEEEVNADIVLHDPVIVEADSSAGTPKKVTYDCIWFGSYPQTEIVDQASTSGCYGQNWETDHDYEVNNVLYNELQDYVGWDSHGETTIRGKRYKRISFSDTTIKEKSKYLYNWDDSIIYHYFRYDPIKWRVLNVDDTQAFLLSEKCLDCKYFNEASDVTMWDQSTIRSWLNGYGPSSNACKIDYSDNGFYDTAFIETEQQAILSSKVDNTTSYPLCDQFLGVDTTDKVFLLSCYDLYKTEESKSYGFYTNSYSNGSNARKSRCSGYSKAMGVLPYSLNLDLYKDSCMWWLRSSGGGRYPGSSIFVSSDGAVMTQGVEMMYLGVGVRPALKMNLSVPGVWAYAGTVCSDGTEDNLESIIIDMDPDCETTPNTDIPISAEITAENFVPTSNNMSWSVESSDGKTAQIGEMSILTSGDKKYILSSIFRFPKAGEYTVTLQSNKGASASMSVKVKGEETLTIKQPTEGKEYAFAGNVDQDKTFVMTLDKADETPSISDFKLSVKKSNSLLDTPAQEVSGSPAEIKNIQKVSDQKYDIIFSYKPDETGLYGFTVTYKDSKDDTELMVYDSNLLEKLDKDLDKTVKTYYQQYSKKVKAEVKELYKEEDDKTDYILLAQELRKDAANIMNGSAIGDSNVDADSIELCAFEAYARFLEKVAIENNIKFDEIDNDTASTMITQAVVKYITTNTDDNRAGIDLDSKAEINGKQYDVTATWQIRYGNGSICIRVQDKSRDGKNYIYSITNSKLLNSIVAEYIKALNELNDSAQKNVAKEWYATLVDLLDWDILKDIDKEKERILTEMSEDIVKGLEKHGIKNILDNLKTCRAYYKQAKKIEEKMQSASSVLKNNGPSLTDQFTSIYEISQMKTNTLEPGDCSKDIYNLLKNAETAWRGYMLEYFKTGTIKDLETENLMDTLKDGIKNVFKCPVSVAVFAPSGEQVGYVGEDDIWFTGEIIIEENSDTKIIYTPKAAGYHFKVNGQHTGAVSYSVEEMINGKASDMRLNYYDIPIEKDSVIEIELPNDSVQTVNDVNLSIEGNISKPEIVIPSSAVTVSINNNPACGTVTGAGTYLPGDMITVTAEPSDQYQFSGWYEGDLFKTFSSEYQFEVKGSTVLRASYTPKPTEGELNELLEINHTHEGGSATCEKGPICVICDKEYGSPLGHAFTNYISDQNATTTKDGTKTALCDRGCGAKNTIVDIGSKKSGQIVETIKISTIGLSAISTNIAAGKSIQLTATILPENVANKQLKWISSDTKIATVTQTGKVSIKKGTGGKSVTITAQATDGSGVSTSFKIKVMKAAVKKITIKGAKKTLKVSKTMKLKAVVKTTKGKPVNKKVRWTSSNTKYATVSSSGKVKALKAGKGKKVTITAMATDGTGKKKKVSFKIK